jgi:putative transposase
MQKTISFLKEATTMDQISHAVRSSRWKDIILQCQSRPAGMSAKQWMTENQVSEKSYYYWQRRFRTEAFKQVDHSSLLPVSQGASDISFAEIRIPETKKSVSDTIPETIRPAAVIKTATMTIALSNDITGDLLSIILREVSHA